MKNFFLSLKTTVWTLLVLICLFFVGSYMMPTHREVFAPMNDDILIHWVENRAVQNLWDTWWFFAVLAALVLLTVNTLVCSIQAVKGRWSRTDFLLRIAPQIVHAGFLCILFAHLLGFGWGFKLSGLMPEGAYAPLPDDQALYLKKVHVSTDARGVITDWTAEVYLYVNDQVVKSGNLGPNTPLFYRGTGIYLKSLNFESGTAAILLIASDPGAIWALAGAALFTIGSVMLFVLKWKKA
jgi:cytochrome c biogenesis protein ResB